MCLLCVFGRYSSRPSAGDGHLYRHDWSQKFNLPRPMQNWFCFLGYWICATSSIFIISNAIDLSNLTQEVKKWMWLFRNRVIQVHYLRFCTQRKYCNRLTKLSYKIHLVFRSFWSYHRIFFCKLILQRCVKIVVSTFPRSWMNLWLQQAPVYETL